MQINLQLLFKYFVILHFLSEIISCRLQPDNTVQGKLLACMGLNSFLRKHLFSFVASTCITINKDIKRTHIFTTYLIRGCFKLNVSFSAVHWIRCFYHNH